MNDIDYSKIVKAERSSSRSRSSFNLNNAIPNNLDHFIDMVEKKLNESIELYDSIHSDKSSNDKSRKELQRSKIDELISSANFFQTLLNWLIMFTTRSLQPLNLQILRLIPLVCFEFNLSERILEPPL
jgi:hypothetical protein